MANKPANPRPDNPCEPADPSVPNTCPATVKGSVTITYAAEGCNWHDVGVWIAGMQRHTVIRHPSDWGGGGA